MKALIPALALGGLLGLSSMAHAADGTITINGVVEDTTCSINGGTAGSSYSKTITLPSVNASSLTSPGQTAGTSQPADLHFALSGCTSGVKAIASFENGSKVNQDSGNLINSGTAENVEVQLLNGNMAPINITTNSNNTMDSNGAAITGGVADLKYFARYYATGQATAGTVNTSVNFTMQYQ
ncbi:fimbrial protein [Bordetella genomosp. 12]|uniref:Fimbrial protein n=1 Tax=Bordetella genomosp. 12 TaxID=463035 RepID=A0A261VUH7_9BORD|nr:fimbrial protein [Bordetella genomosp. 12]OZI77689.1 fimbrial protein [Bordetella genomosp. 12]